MKTGVENFDFFFDRILDHHYIKVCIQDLVMRQFFTQELFCNVSNNNLKRKSTLYSVVVMDYSCSSFYPVSFFTIP
jgi:hypothetical protein